ncbi:leucine rich repeat containing 51 isoform X2 [Myxocyprinus asiaticus]|uniref:leucine rich repeat containing 51 isoform X2 n=1 Tax=Myxocyprinus asiaticus TaxID=70543 RepID=UPI00222163C6|nr:leucine rich repeat containing 51 isoform X2 [Myxocyprinus asiaticus]
MIGSPVDFSFKHLSAVSDTLSDEPNPGARPLKRNSEQKFHSRALRLNNNNITDLIGLMDTISGLLVEPTRLAWLDLSFNDIPHIDPVRTLPPVPGSHSASRSTLVVSAWKQYLAHVIATLPHLKTMDFSAVTKQERELASIWQKGRNQRKSTSHSKVNRVFPI